MPDHNQNQKNTNPSENNKNRNGHWRRNHRRSNTEPGRQEAPKEPRTEGKEPVRSSEAPSLSHAEKENKHTANNRQASRNENKRNRNRNDRRKSGEKPRSEAATAESAADMTLSELRAQIVLKAADGTVPTAAVPMSQKDAETEKTKKETAPAPAGFGNRTAAAVPDSSAPAQGQDSKAEVIGVRFHDTGKMYYFSPCGIQVKKGDHAIVETTRGLEFGEICLANTVISLNEALLPLRPLIRIATPADVEHHAENREKEKEALLVCQEKIREHKLDMKLIDTQYAFDNSKLLFYFSAEGRVDFRDLVKDLASVFRTRIELRQIGIRDEAKLLGGIGSCGRTLCCATFLPDFTQVSIKMAKEQGLSLNSAKISGMCGRLMCCLRYESDVYTEEIRKTPSNDSTVRTPDGIGTVIGSNPLAGTVRVIMKDSPDSPPKQYHRDDVTVLPKERKNTSEKQEEEKKTNA